MSIRPRIFVSAVSREFRSARKHVAAKLRKLGYDPVTEDDFPTGHGELCDWLRTQIDDCEGVIQLVGVGYGEDVPPEKTGLGRMSYTQWEQVYAAGQGKKIWIFEMGDSYPPDTPLDELDLPDNEDDDWRGKYGVDTPRALQAQKRELQRAYVAALKQQNALRHGINEEKDLTLAVQGLRDELGELRRSEQRRAAFGLRVAVATLALVLMAVALLLRPVLQSDEVTANRVRAQLESTIEQTYQRELAAADALTSWSARERGRQAAAEARDARLARVDELVRGFQEVEGGVPPSDVLKEMERIVAEPEPDGGVDAAIDYVASKRSGLLASARQRAAQASAANRRDLRPLLQQAGLLDTQGRTDEARENYRDILAIEPDWPAALHQYLWFLIEQGKREVSYGSLEQAMAQFRAAQKIAGKLVDLDEQNPEWQRDLSVSHNYVGDVLIAQGDGPGALAAYEKGLTIRETLAQRDPTNTEWQRDLSVSHSKIGDVLKAQGDGPGALAGYQKSLEIAESLAQRDPANTQWQRDLSVSHSKIGVVLKAQGDGPGALAAYEESLAIRESLAQRDPANTEWQRDLSISHDRIGDVLKAQGDGPGAQAAYEKSLEIAESLAQRDPANTEWQRDLSVSHNKIGDALEAQGDGPGALAAYQKSLAIRESLAQRDPANTQWQRDLSVSHNKIGDVLKDQGDGPGALAAYQKSLAIRESLAQRDPTNTEWQRDLSVSHNKIGDVLKAQGDGPGARAAYQKSLEIAESLAQRDLANTQWQRDLSISHDRIGDVLKAQGDGPGALAAYEKSLAIRESLAQRDPANTQWQRDLSISHDRIGDVLKAQGDGPGALAAYEKSLAIRESLAQRDPANTEWQRDMSVSHNKVGDVLIAQGDGPGALAAYEKGLDIAESLAQRDPANAVWQVDLAISLSKLGTSTQLSTTARRQHLERGRKILTDLNAEGRLPPTKNFIPWFDARLSELNARND